MNEKLPVIDCDAEPFVPEGWKILSHTKSGKLVWDIDKVGLYLPPCQCNIVPSLACEVEAGLKDIPVLNANVLDYLLAHPEYAEVEALSWMKNGGAVLFWGSIYENNDNERTVRCLMFNDGTLDWGQCGDLETVGLMDCHPAAVSLFGRGGE